MTLSRSRYLLRLRVEVAVASEDGTQSPRVVVGSNLNGRDVALRFRHRLAVPSAQPAGGHATILNIEFVTGFNPDDSLSAGLTIRMIKGSCRDGATDRPGPPRVKLGSRRAQGDGLLCPL